MIYLIALRIIINILVTALLLYITVIFLPDSLNINETVSKWIFIIMLFTLLTISKEKGWIQLISMFLGLAVFMLFINLFVS
ncbi:hypothetical protein [Bacillus sp. ISL-57]|uniref:hypothetical protein n=1 Tax=Bacillus sp. ISL-57 TaxID=2819135 RepID=UPI001BE7083A|nr:hypothetical protein [Bacillus sp. ISL-57]MBT2719380.1 hypothetical protein [Bacillus sp. ISL-57]